MTDEEAIEVLTSNVVENPELMYEALDMAIKALEKKQRDCKTCKYYTGKTGGRMSKTKRYCNRTATINMHPDDFCSRWDKREEMQNATQFEK